MFFDGGLIPQLYLIYMKYRRQWNGIVTYIQRISQGQEVHPTLLAQGAYQVKAPQGCWLQLELFWVYAGLFRHENT